MSSRRESGKSSFPGPSNSPSKGKGVSTHHDQLSHNMTNLSLGSTQDGNDWEVFSKKSKNKAGGNTKQWGTQSTTPNAWGHPNVAQKLGTNSQDAWRTQGAGPKRTNGRGVVNPQSYYGAPPTAVGPPLQNGWQWGATARGSPATQGQGTGGGEGCGSDAANQEIESDVDEEDDDLVEDDDDDLMSDDFDSDDSVKSHETRKRHKWFKTFFEVLDKLSVEELNEPSRQWHCPACRNGPGAIDWYKGLQPLMAHAKTKGAKRVKLHRELAELLDEELIRRGTSVIPAGEAFGKWEGLRQTGADREVIWPPMVVVMNTQLEMDENDQKWIGMGNQELLDYFSSYTKMVKARHSYGPKGHRGISIVIFESSPVGYLEAEHLHKHFTDQGKGRYDWDHRRVLFQPGGKRQLYGYMAIKEDLDNFNKHCQGKTKLKFELRSHQEMVVVPMRQMSEDNQQLVWLKNKVVKEQKHSKALEESFSVLSQKLRKTTEENRIVRLRTKMQHEHNKEEMDYQEKFFNEKLSDINKILEEKERAFEERLQAERRKAADSRAPDDKHRREKIAEFIQSQAKGIEEFETEREKLIKMHEDKKADMKRRHMEEEIELEKDFESSLTRLMEKYAPPSSEEISTAAP